MPGPITWPSYLALFLFISTHHYLPLYDRFICLLYCLSYPTRMLIHEAGCLSYLFHSPLHPQDIKQPGTQEVIVTH